ncbi:MAG: PulJ/GspJ family protein, partial [Planctomycetota bacterium]
MSQPDRQDGFTLIEVLLAIAISATVMVVVATSFIGILQARQRVDAQTESTEAGARILNLLQRDLEGLWYHNIKKNKILVGRNHDIAGFAADKIDFLTSTDATGYVLDTEERLRKPSICEVGYWLKTNPDTPGLMQLWRREDPLVDDDLTTQGTFQLVHDRIRSFNITYHETIGHSAEEINEWDSSIADELPKVIKIEFSLERKIPSRNRAGSAEVEDPEGTVKKYIRYIVFDHRFNDILKPGVALVPILPRPPQAAEEGGGPAGPAGGGGGPAGPGGRGGDKARGADGRSILQGGPGGDRSKTDGRTTIQTRGSGQRGGRGGGRGGG